MAAGESVDRERQSVEHEQPCEEEMPLAARGERTPARQGRPGGEAAHGGLAEYFGGAEDAGGIEACAADLRDAPDFAGWRLDRGHREDRFVEMAGHAPIERGMGVEYLQTAHQHDK